MNVVIKQIITEEYQIFTYIVGCPDTGSAAIIDPAGDTDKILHTLSKEKLRAKYILNTHAHPDHILANPELKEKLSIPVGMHQKDLEFFSDPENLERIYKEFGLACKPEVELSLEDGEVLNLGSLEIKLLHTPGHSPGSSCFWVHGNLFTGDTLFVGVAGRTDILGSSLQELLASIRDKLLVLPRDTVVWPGHNYCETPNSTIAREMEDNIYITDFLL